MIIKYKLLNGEIPKNILDGGYFVKDDYLFGIGFDSNQQIITKEELLQEVLQQHQSNPYTKEQSEEPLTEQQVIDIVNNWCETKGE